MRGKQGEQGIVKGKEESAELIRMLFMDQDKHSELSDLETFDNLERSIIVVRL